MAVEALRGVGDARAGEWAEDGRGGVAHYRRRLSAAEARAHPPVEDIRDTPEELERLRVLLIEAEHLRPWVEDHYPALRTQRELDSRLWIPPQASR